MIAAAPITQAETLLQAGSATLQVTEPVQVNAGDTFEIRGLLDQPPPDVFGFQFRLNDGDIDATDAVLASRIIASLFSGGNNLCQA